MTAVGNTGQLARWVYLLAVLAGSTGEGCDGAVSEID